MKASRFRSRSIFLDAAGVAAVLILWSATSDAQEVRCRANRQNDGSFTGRCLQSDSVAGDIRLRQQSGAPHLWLGTIRGPRFQSAATGGAAGESEIGVDVRPGGALRLGRSWLALRDTGMHGDELRFVFRLDRSEPASDTDVRILETARAMLAETSRWNRADTTDMSAAPVKGFTCAPAERQSMFCAIYLASVEVAGDYAHFRPAVNAVRESVNAASKRRYQHPLIGFNNDSSVSLADVQGVLDVAIAAMRAERARGQAPRRPDSAGSNL